MTDDLEKSEDNPALKLAEEIVAARLERAGVRLGEDWGLQPSKPEAEWTHPPELIRKIASG